MYKTFVNEMACRLKTITQIFLVSVHNYVDIMKFLALYY